MSTFFHDRRKTARVAGLVSLILLLVAVFHWGPPIRQQWILQEARQAILQLDFRYAALLIQRVLEMDPSSIDARNLKATLLEDQAPAQALEVWLLLARDTDRPGFWAAALESSLRADETNHLAEAEAALARLQPSDPEALRLRTSALVRMDQLDQARVLMDQLVHDSDPSPLDRFNRAVLHLDSTQGQPPTAEWMEELRALSKLPQTDVLAIRTLRDLAIRSGDWPRASTHSASLLVRPAASYMDRFIEVRIHDRLQDGSGPAVLQSFLLDIPHPVIRAELAHRLVHWGSTNLAWQALETSGTEIWRQPAALSAGLGVLASLEKWNDILLLLSRDDIPRNVAILEAWRARASWKTGRERKGEIHFSSARTLSRRNESTAFQLARSLEAWELPDKARWIWWDLASTSKHRNEARSRLMAYFLERNLGNEMLDALDSWLALEPENPTLMNNLAHASMILGRTSEQTWLLARKVYEIHPGNTRFAATYAMSLWMRGQAEEASRVTALMPQCNEPETRLLKAILAASMKKSGEARQLVSDIPEKAVHFKEKQWLAACLEGHCPEP